MRRLLSFVALALSLTACGKAKPTSGAVCAQLVTAGVAANCKDQKPAGLGAAAIEGAVFDLPSVPGKTGQVLRFQDQASYDATVKAFDSAAVLAGPHRYGNPTAWIFVQLNSSAGTDVGAKAKAMVDGL